MNMSRRLLAGFAFVALGGVGTALPLWAGPLSPPAGPVAPSYKTLQEVEPRTAVNAVNTPGDATAVYVISAPGSYYLTENLTGQPGKHGVRIAASNVTLDLNGFTLTGGANTLNGITLGSEVVAVENIRILNGLVQGWGAAGVDANAPRCVVRDVHSLNNALDGVVLGDSGQAERCTAENNGGFGFNASATAVSVRECIVRNNGAGGVRVGFSALVERCIVENNNGSGILAGDGSTIAHCLSRSNKDTGIAGAGGSFVHHNTVVANGRDGINVSSESFVLQNTCTSHKNVLGGVSAGIKVAGSLNRIEGNHLNDNDIGLLIAQGGANNIIIRNNAHGSAVASFSFDMAANIWGPIITGPGQITNFTPDANYGD